MYVDYYLPRKLSDVLNIVPPEAYDLFVPYRKPSVFYTQYIDEKYFNRVCCVRKYSSFDNKRTADPCYFSFLQKLGREPDIQWGLAHPNEEAAYKNIGKYCNDQININEKAFKIAFDFTYKHFYPIMGNSRFMDVKEAISHLDPHSSNGFILNRFYTKAELKEDPWFVDYVQSIFDNNLVDGSYTCLWTSSLKEETRPLEKLDQNKIRNFLAGPADLTVLCDVVFGEMNDKLYSSPLLCASAIGLNPFKGGWERAFQKLCKYRHNAVALDESSYDSTLRQVFMLAVRDLRKLFLHKDYATKSNFSRIDNLYRELIFSLVIMPDGNVCFKVTGNPSGSGNTISDNTLILFMILSYCWIVLTGNTDLRCFEINVPLLLCGDDNTFTVSDDFKRNFNPKNISVTMSSIGITTTSEFDDFVDLERVSFLSSSFNYVIAGQHLYCLDGEKAIESLKWTDKPGDIINSLNRAIGIFRVLWGNMRWRKHMRDYVDYLLSTYDHLYQTMKEWQEAKESYTSDLDMYIFYSGVELGSVESLKSPIKTIIMECTICHQIPNGSEKFYHNDKLNIHTCKACLSDMQLSSYLDNAKYFIASKPEIINDPVYINRERYANGHYVRQNVKKYNKIFSDTDDVIVCFIQQSNSLYVNKQRYTGDNIQSRSIPPASSVGRGPRVSAYAVDEKEIPGPSQVRRIRRTRLRRPAVQIVPRSIRVRGSRSRALVQRSVPASNNTRNSVNRVMLRDMRLEASIKQNPYLMTMLDPCNYMAKVPDIITKSSVLVQTKGNLVLSTADTTGALAFVLSPTWHSFVVQAGTVAGLATWTSGLTTNAVPNTTTLQATYGLTRPVSACWKFSYIGPIQTAAGVVSVAPIQSVTVINNFENTTYSANAIGSQVSVFNALEGMEIIWRPTDVSDHIYLGEGSNSAETRYEVFYSALPQGVPCISIDYTLNMECQGASGANGLNTMTPSPSNAKWLEHASSIISSVQHAKSNQDKEPWWKKALNVAKEIGKVALPIAGLLL